MENEITDKYGNKVGSVEQRGNGDYVVRDKYGMKTGTAEKEFLGSDYNIYDNHGGRVGKTDADLFGIGTTIRDKNGRKVGRVEPSPAISDGTLIAIIAVGVLIVLSFKKMPEHLVTAFSGFSAEFIVITLPILAFVIINIVELVRGKGSLFQNADGYMMTLIMEVLHGVIAYFCGIALLLLEGWLIEGVNFFEALVFSLIAVLIYAASYLVLLLPLSFFFAGIIRKRKLD